MLYIWLSTVLMNMISAVSAYGQTDSKTYTLTEIQKYGVRLLVNKNYLLPQGYAPNGLVVANGKVRTEFANTQLLPEVLKALESMFAAAKAEEIDLILFAGFRSEQTQRLFYERAGGGNSMSVAPPRGSEHETGYAADILAVDSMIRNSSFGETKAGMWLQKNAPHCGKLSSKEIFRWHLQYFLLQTLK